MYRFIYFIYNEHPALFWVQDRAVNKTKTEVLLSRCLHSVGELDNRQTGKYITYPYNIISGSGK